MPKIRDLGINVIPEITRPPEVGQGGGCGPTHPCGWTHQTQYTDCGATDCSGRHPQNYGCAWSMNCGAATLFRSADCPVGGQYNQHGPCGAATFVLSATCPPPHYQRPPCGAATIEASIGCTPQFYREPPCGGGTFAVSVDCYAQQLAPCGGGTFGNSVGCYGHPALTREAIAQLKDQLQKQIEQLEEYAKNIGPKTAEEIDAREKELKAELADLAKRRQGLGK
ncbi:MAG TPA: hypothetical protein VGR02_03645 [Thermoanaerobaculia bacterium]|jgi:hypothetical protein|nr:hypothetical protein [Thermoanaerobaculia bacterium]